MVGVVFLTRIVAHQFANDIGADVAIGYPRLGVRNGGGTHVPLLQGRTTRYAAIMKHSTLSRWMFPDDPVIVGMRARVPLPGGATSQTLDSTWDDATED